MIIGKKILLLGGAGFIGTALTKQLCKNNEVIVADICDFSRSSLSLAGLVDNPNVKTLRLNVTDEKEVFSLSDDYDYIIHAVAILGIHKVVEQSILTIDTNYTSCKNALELCRKQKNLKNFMSFSTSEVYGKNITLASEEKDMSIGFAKEARWCYAASKVLCEHLISGYHREHNVPAVIIRPFNVFGEYRLGSNAMSTFIFKSIINTPITIDGDGSQIRTWCHIEDFVKGLLLALEKSNKCEVFNIGNPSNSITILELAELVKKITASDSEISVSNKFIPDVATRTLVVDKAEKLLGYSPNIDLREGITKVYNWAKTIDKKQIRKWYM